MEGLDAGTSAGKDADGGAAPSAITAATRQTIVRHLPYFLIVAQEEHFHKAAAILNVTQSALSRRVQMLEQELGGQLFNRGQRGVSLTEVGRVFYQDVRSIMSELERSITTARALVRGEEGELRIGVNEGALRSPPVGEALREFRTTVPRAKLELVSSLSDEQSSGLLSQELDGGFFYQLPDVDIPEEAFGVLPISQEALLLALPADEPLARQDHIRIRDLSSIALAWPSRKVGRHLYDWMISEFRAANVSPIIGMEVVSAESTVSLAASGLGRGFVGADQIVPPDVALRRVEDFDVRLKLQFVWRRDRKAGAMQKLVALLQDHVSRNGPRD